MTDYHEERKQHEQKGEKEKETATASSSAVKVEKREEEKRQGFFLHQLQTAMSSTSSCCFQRMLVIYRTERHETDRFPD